jgi:hypothetical protein
MEGMEVGFNQKRVCPLFLNYMPVHYSSLVPLSLIHYAIIWAIDMDDD